VRFQSDQDFEQTNGKKTMKHRLQIGAALLVAAMTMVLVGCATPEKAAYNTLATTAQTVEAGRKAWVDYVTQQRQVLATGTQARAELEMQVQQGAEVYAKYQQAMRVARAAVTTWKTAPQDQTALNTALDVLAKTAGEFIKFAGQITGKL
jgi:type IV pilus biogenesis protein CpaD/CtpE